MSDKRQSMTRSGKSPAAEKGKPARKGYQPPLLTEYGAIGKLTQNNATGSFADGGGMLMAMPCL